MKQKRKPRIVIRMGACKFTADVRVSHSQVLHFDINKMDKQQRREFRVELVKAWRVAA